MVRLNWRAAAACAAAAAAACAAAAYVQAGEQGTPGAGEDLLLRALDGEVGIMEQDAAEDGRLSAGTP